MPDVSGLYPQPPQQQPQGSSLLSNPGQAVGIMQGLQNLQIQSQQAPALVQRPGVDLGTAQINQNTAQLQFDQELRRNAYKAVGDQIVGLGHKPTNDEVINAIVNAKRQLPPQASVPLLQMQEELLGEKDRIGRGRTYQAMSLDPSAAAAPVSGPYGPAGEQRQISQFDAVRMGPKNTTPPPGTAEQRQADEADIAGFNARTTPLRKIVELEKELGPNGFGEGSAGRQRIESFLVTAFPGIASDALKNKVSVYDQARKYMTQNAAALSQGMAPHTNDSLNTTIHGSPNTENVAAGDLAKVQLALESMRTANLANAHRKDENGNYIVPLEKVAGEKARGGIDMDYRAFIPRDQKEWNELNKAMTGAERKRFNRSYGYGVKAGVIQEE